MFILDIIKKVKISAHDIKIGLNLGIVIALFSTISYLFIARTPENEWKVSRANNVGFSFPFAVVAVSNKHPLEL